MVITDRFVYIHQPKTGGTFVTDALLELYGAKWGRWPHLKMATLGWTEWKQPLGIIRMQDKHGGCKRIPAKFTDRPIFSTVRNPFDYYVSQYEFGWWKRREWIKYYRTARNAGQLLENFPQLSFEAYLRLMVASFNKPENQEFDNPDHLGHYSTSFIRLFFKNTQADEYRNSETYFTGNDFQKDQYPVTFLTTKDLNVQLHHYLLSLGYEQSLLEFIVHKKKVLPQGKGRSKDQKWQKYYTPELMRLIREKDALLFNLIPEFSTIQSI